ncbi:T9SS type B sorting domain-containing protein, partial [Flavobacterium sp. HXWNR69]
YVTGLTYNFTPVGPTVDSTGLISGMTFGTSYVVSANNGSCSSTDSSSFVVSPILPSPTLVSIVSNNVICEGTTGSLTITATPNTIVTYNIDGGVNQTVNIDSSGFTTITTPVLFADSVYNVIYIESTIAPFCGQSQTGSAIVDVNPIPSVTIIPALTTICSGTSTSINLSSTVSSTTFSWVVLNQVNVTGASASSGNIISQVLTATSGTVSYVEYSVTPTANGCVGPAQTVRIDVSPLPTVVPNNNNASFCTGGTTNIQLSSNVAEATFYWTVTGGNVQGASGGSGNLINQTLTVTPGTTSTVEVVYTIIAEANGCSGTPVVVRVNVTPIPNVIVANDPTPICSGESTDISFTGAVPGTTFNWVVVSGTGVMGATNGSGNAIQQVLIATGLMQGSVTYQVTPTFNGCTGTSETVTILVNPTPELFADPIHPDLCSGINSTNIFLETFNPNTIFEWTVSEVGVDGASDGSNAGLSTVIQQVLTTTGDTRGYVDYYITPRLDDCRGQTIVVRVYVNPIPQPTLIDGVICVDASGNPFQTFVLDSGLSSTTHDFVWYFNNNPIPNSNNATYTADEVGTYGVMATVRSTNCSSQIVTATITSSTPSDGITVEQSNYFSGNATLVVTVTGGTGVLEYQLDNGALQSSNVFTNVSSGPHTITVVDTQGCTHLTYDVYVIEYPQYFTPNGDGYNDTWFIAGLQTTDKINIFDRYGKFIKQLNGEEGWDGTYNQEQLPSTDYWFTVDFSENDTQKQFKAHFSLKR